MGDSSGRKQKRPSGMRRCPTCRGAGRIPGVVKTTNMGSGMGSGFGWCPECDGQGWTPADDRQAFASTQDDDE